MSQPVAVRLWRHVWITGASSGIGRDLALQLARSGVAVAASARSADALVALCAEQPGITAYPLDVSDRVAVRAVADRILADTGSIDLAILNAGVWHPMGADGYDAGKSADSMTVNYLGICYAVEALLPAMRSRGQGHIAMVSSVAGYRGLPKAAAYSPSKAAVISLAESLQPELAGFGIDVSIINPGFVATPMTRVNTFPMPFIVSSDDAARRIIRGLAKRKFEIAFPWPLVAMTKLGRLLPYAVFFWYARTFLTPRKPG